MPFDYDRAESELHRLITEEPDLEIETADRTPQLIILGAALCSVMESYNKRPQILMLCVRAIVERTYRLGYRDGEANERVSALLGAKEDHDDRL